MAEPEQTSALTSPDAVDSVRTIAHGAVEAPSPVEEPGPSPGQGLGRYVVLGEVGRGGMGRVLRAYDPRLRREVAIKLLRAPRSPEARARIVREAQAMARLSHPNIVAIYDADELDGQPYIAMEFVEGVTLREWLGKRHGWQEALALLLQAGRGLQAAHAAGIVHRDFKPANVMVGSDGRVRVTDFGIARASGEPVLTPAAAEVATIGDDDALTAIGTVLGTPPYLAPELEDGEVPDARCDLYGFCVTAWEALFGARPFKGVGDELRAAKRAGPPRVPASSAVPRSIATLLVRGLDPDPARRPGLSVVLAALERDPGKRRRIMMGLATAVVLAGTGVGLWQLQQHRARTACADQGAAITAVWSPTVAESVAAAFRATGVADAEQTFARTAGWLDDYAAGWEAAREDTCVAATLDRSLSAAAWEAAQACFDDRRDGLASLVEQLGHADGDTLRRAVMAAARVQPFASCSDPAMLARELAPAPEQRAEVARVRRGITEVSSMLAIGHYGPARERADEVAVAAAALGFLPCIVNADLAVGATAAKLGDYEAARVRYESAFRQAGANGLDDLAADAASRLTLLVGYEQREHERGLAWGSLAEMWLDRLGVGEDLRRASAVTNLGTVYHGMGRYDDAGAAFARALAIREAAQGPSHPETAALRANLGLVDYALGRYDDALAEFEQAIAIQRAALGDAHPEIGRTLGSFGVVYLAKGDLERARQYHLDALANTEAAHGPEHPDVAGLVANLGSIEQARGNPGEALVHQRRALAIFERTLDPGHPNIAASLNNIGGLELERGDPAAAKPLFERAARLMEARLGLDHPELVAPLLNVAMVQLQLGEHDAALAGFERVRAIAAEHYGTSHATHAESVGWIGRAQLARGERSEGLASLREAEAVLAGLPDAAVELERVRAALVEANAPR